MKVGLSGAVRGRSLVSVLGHFDLFELVAVFDPDDEAAGRACRDLGQGVERAPSLSLRESLAVSLPASLAVLSRDRGGEWVRVPSLEEL